MVAEFQNNHCLRPADVVNEPAATVIVSVSGPKDKAAMFHREVDAAVKRVVTEIAEKRHMKQTEMGAIRTG